LLRRKRSKETFSYQPKHAVIQVLENPTYQSMMYDVSLLNLHALYIPEM
jgi:hypothetical protein